ncbi:MAG: cytochrome c family protein [Candidatus Hydrogenedentota bacterium]
MKRTLASNLAFPLSFVIFLSLGHAIAQEPAKSYVDSRKCKLCHNVPEKGGQYTSWKSHAHANALDTLYGKKAQRFADDLGITVPPYESPECLKCHVTGYDSVTRSMPKELRMEDGVQCGSCHGPASAHLKDARILHMDKDAKLDLGKNILMPNNATCIACHNEEAPPWNPKKYTLESGEKTGFDFTQAVKVIAHPNPNRVAHIASAIQEADSATAKK